MSNSDLTISRLLLANALALQLAKDVMNEISNIAVMDDVATFDVLVSIQRKSDGGRAHLRVHRDDIKSWCHEARITLSEAEKAMLILFLQP